MSYPIDAVKKTFVSFEYTIYKQSLAAGVWSYWNKCDRFIFEGENQELADSIVRQKVQNFSPKFKYEIVRKKTIATIEAIPLEKKSLDQRIMTI